MNWKWRLLLSSKIDLNFLRASSVGTYRTETNLSNLLISIASRKEVERTRRSTKTAAVARKRGILS